MTTDNRSPLSPYSTQPYRDANVEATLARLLGVGGRTGWVDDADLYPRLRTNRETQELTMRTVRMEFTPLRDATGEEVELTRMLEYWTDNMRTDAANDNGSRGHALAQVVGSYWLAGHYVAEVRFVDTPTGYVLEVYRIHHSTISDWARDPDSPDRIVGVWQRTPSSHRYIPAERLVMLHWGGPGPTGVPGYRVMLQWMDSGKTSLQALGGKQSADQGLMKITMAPGASASAYQYVRNYLEDGGAGTLRNGQPYVVIDKEEGIEDIDVMFAASGQSDPSAWMRYLDSVCDHRMWMTASTHGATAGTGSRALAEVSADIDAGNLSSFLRALAADWSRALARTVIGILARAGQVYTGRVPVLDIARGETELTVDDRLSAFERLAPHLGSAAGRVATYLASEIGVPDEVLAEPEVVDEANEEVQALEAPTVTASAHHDCGCGSCTTIVQAAAQVEMHDAYGDVYHGCKSLDRMSAVERFVAWGALEDELGRVESTLERQIGEIASAHREAMRGVLDGLPLETPPQVVERELTEASTNAYQAYYRACAQSAEDALRIGREHAAREAEAQVPGGADTPREGGDTPEIAQVGRSEVARARAQAGTAATAIYQRVIGEMRAAWSSGADMATWKTRQTDSGLAGEAKGVVYTSETAGRLEQAAEIEATSGMVIVSLQRSSVRDARRCSVCAERDGGEHPDVGVWDVSTPEGVADYMADPNKQTPDPDCKGGAERCRCGIIAEWAPASEIAAD